MGGGWVVLGLLAWLIAGCATAPAIGRAIARSAAQHPPAAPEDDNGEE